MHANYNASHYAGGRKAVGAKTMGINEKTTMETMKNPGGDELRRRSDAVKDLSFNTIGACNIELDATVFAAAQNEPNIPPDISDISVGTVLLAATWPR